MASLNNACKLLIVSRAYPGSLHHGPKPITEQKDRTTWHRE
jgi:hypothetical protein